jgi:hypothetical protein
VQLPDEETSEQVLPTYRDIAWDYDKNAPIFANGEPRMVEGIEAVKSWAYNALQIERQRYPIYSDQYGSDFEELLGQSFTQELKEAEAKRYLEECLLQSPYITAVKVTEVSFEDGKLLLRAELTTIYGDEVIAIG